MGAEPLSPAKDRESDSKFLCGENGVRVDFLENGVRVDFLIGEGEDL